MSTFHSVLLTLRIVNAYKAKAFSPVSLCQSSTSVGSPKKKMMIKKMLIIAIVVKKTALCLRKTRYKAASVPHKALTF
jgi:hypothetical protein